MALELKDMKFFIAVYEQRGFSSASKFLGTVQSNVSARILGLEDALGEPLFERRWRSVVPTSKGDKFYAYAKGVIATVDDGDHFFRAARAA
jgi:DNA-binding transcriptional LysR family regulator